MLYKLGTGPPEGMLLLGRCISALLFRDVDIMADIFSCFAYALSATAADVVSYLTAYAFGFGGR